MKPSRLLLSRYFKPSTFISLALCISAAANGRPLLPDESVTVNQGDTPETWSMAEGATLTVNSGAQILNVGGSGASTLNLNAGSSARSVNLHTGSVANIVGSTITSTSTTPAFFASGTSVTMTDATLRSNGIGASGLQEGGGPGSAFMINGGRITGGTGGMSLSVKSTLDATGTTIEGTGATSFGVQALNSNLTLRNSTVAGGLNGILYRGSPGASGTIDLVGTHVEGGTGAAIQITGQRDAVTANLNLLNGTTLTGGNGNALEVTNNATANVLLQASDVVGNVAISNGSTADLRFDQGRLTGNLTADQTSTNTLAMANGSAITGDVSGVNSVNLDASSITGNVTATSTTSTLALRNRSVLNGNVTGIDNVSLDASAMTGDITSATPAGIVALSNGSALEGVIKGSDTVTLDGSSMKGAVTSASASGQVSLVNGAVLNGNVSSNNVNLSASALTGDITSIDGKGIVSLQNESVFTGNLVNVDQVTIGDPSVWNMTGSNTVNSLVMTDGAVKFGAANEFYQLNVGTLSGNGTFIMDADFATNEHDTLNVTGSATGNHTLQVAGSGVDPVSPQALNLVHTAGGDATFALANGRPVDVGTYSYDLASSANGSGGSDWFLDPTTKTISPGTRSVLALFNTAPTVWYGELTSLRSRMGELRFNGGKAGGWARTYGNKYDVNESSGLGYQQTQQGFSLGADAPLPIGDGQWLIGVLAGHSTSDLDVSRGTSGTVKSYYVGAYTTWLDQDTGYYFDGVLKLNRFRNDAKVSMSDGTRAKGDYDNVGLGGSVEFGRHIKLNDGYFVEPYTQWSTVVIQGKDYGLDNGMEAQGDRTRSLLGKVGVTAGRNFAMAGGSVVQPYVRVAGVHEFAKNNEVQVNNNTFNNDLSGSRGELGAGVAVAFNDRLQMHADFDYSNGDKIEQPFGANVGLRYSW
ncbi:autotransporter outer membrane beta-barrel domain-containing protein [Pseudomonas sp. RC10]|uniref:autotransporter outer membrane beta-barrel domain-containing protein n=1 Tax=Pseudomonas bambusae TaxID=3139142 RepID=UPI003139765E